MVLCRPKRLSIIISEYESVFLFTLINKTVRCENTTIWSLYLSQIALIYCWHICAVHSAPYIFSMSNLICYFKKVISCKCQIIIMPYLPMKVVYLLFERGRGYNKQLNLMGNFQTNAKVYRKKLTAILHHNISRRLVQFIKILWGNAKMTFKIIIALTLGVYPLLGAGASITSNKKKMTQI